jgi:hypothetical protein
LVWIFEVIVKSLSKFVLGLTVGFGLSFPGIAAAETPLGEANGFRFFLDGRINAFASTGFGDAYPEPPLVDPDGDGPLMPASTYSIANGSGYLTNQSTDDGKYFGVRMRSGFVSNVFGFGFVRDVTATTQLRGYIGIWATIETQSRWKYAPVYADVREGYMKLQGPWGSFLAGRTLGLFGLGSTQQDGKYLHGWGLGHPCETGGLDEAGPTCGQIGHGVMFPGFSPGFVYTTPRLGGFALAAGLYDPAIFGGVAERTPYPRPEAELSFDMDLSPSVRVHAFGSGVWQRLGANGTPSSEDVDAYGISYGASLEAGPFRIAGSGFYGPGLGFGIALDGSPAAVRVDAEKNIDLHTFDGYFGVVGVKVDALELGLGAGISRLHLLDIEKNVTNTSLPKTQFGVSAAAYYHFTDYLVGGLDYFRAQYDWYLGDKQVVNFINAGVTVHW